MVHSPIIALLDSSLNVTLYNFAKGTVSGAEKRLVNITGEQMRLQGPLPPPGKYEDASDELKAEYRSRTAELRTNCASSVFPLKDVSLSQDSSVLLQASLGHPRPALEDRLDGYPPLPCWHSAIGKARSSFGGKSQLYCVSCAGWNSLFWIDC